MDIMEGFPEEVTSETSRVLKEGTRDQCSRKSKVRWSLQKCEEFF